MNPMSIIMLRSRNKDNKDIAGFKERTKLFLTDKPPHHHFTEFKRFVAGGVPGEFSRMYISVNARDTDKVKKALLCKMISDDQFDLRNLNNAMVSVAMQKENAAEKRWMFDYDDTPDRIN